MLLIIGVIADLIAGERRVAVRRKTVSGMMLTLLFIGMLTLAINIQPVKAEPTTIVVPDDYPTIQEAINNANDGDTIYVRAGTYYEMIDVNKAVNLIGEDKYTTIIDGTGGPREIIRVYKSYVNITGFTLRNGHYGVRGASYCKIYGNVIEAVRNDGIELSLVSGCVIYGNLIKRGYYGYGIRLDSSSDNIIRNNDCEGIIIWYSSGNDIFENNLKGAGAGVSLVYSVMNNISSNKITGNNWGIDLSWSLHNIISRNHVSENINDGIEFYSSSGNIISYNNINSNGYSGISFFEGSSNNTIRENNIQNNGFSSIYLVSSSDNFIYHNNFIKKPYVLSFDSVNSWDDGYPSGGNYWSDYTGIDEKSGPNQDQSGSDGIGDTPYIINGTNQDRYPLIHPYGSIRNLDTNLTYLTIQSAINAPETLNGHTIFVEAGTYYEHVILNKSVSLVGENRHTTIIDGNRTGTVVYVTVDNVIISGFAIQNSGGISTAGIYINYSSSIMIVNNTVSNNNEGISISHGEYNTVIGNNITLNIWGIELLRNSGNNIIVNNTISNNSWGISLFSNANNTIIGNRITSNDQFGIDVNFCSDNNISANTVTRNLNGIMLSDSNTNTIENNTITSNNHEGIYLHYSSDNTLSGNRIFNNDKGIFLWKSVNNTLSGNNATNNQFGVLFWSSSNCNTVCGNTVTNHEVGIWFEVTEGAPSENIIYHNNFINNTIQAYVEPNSINIWDDGYPSGGNCWSDHVCIGNPSDGSQPYIIDENNIDHYPFQDPNGWIPKYTLTIYSSPTGVTFTVDGVSRTTPWSGTYSEGASVSLVMPETYDGYVWSHWLEDGDTNRIKTILLQGTTWTGVYEPAPKPVGGKATPINIPMNKPETPALWIWLTTIILSLAVTVVYVKKKKQ